MCRDVWARVLLLSSALFVCGAVPLTGDYLGKEEVQVELDMIKQRLLANLGLSRIPDISRANVSEAEMARMRDIYDRSVAESREDEDEEDDEEDDRAIHRFYSYKDNAPVNRTSSSQHMFFPIRISNGQSERHISLHSAKLRIHRPCKGQSATASLYQLLEPWGGSETDRLLVEERKLPPKLTSRSRRRSEVVFDLARPVSSWLESPALNYGLVLQCSSSLQARHSSPRAVLDLLVKERPTRQKRSKNLSGIDGRNIRMECTSSNKTNLCCRYSLTVSFAEIGWNFVHAPKEFQANFCRGKCPHTMTHSFTSNHAIIQSLVSFRKKDVPKPCCAPKKLRALNIMHYNDKEEPEIVVTRYKGMIVKSCGCS